jgi:Xaa-Pro dipeptidase
MMDVMHRRQLDAVALGSREHAYYFSGHFADWRMQAGCILFFDGRSWLAWSGEGESGAATDEAVLYQAKWHSTLRQEQPQVVAEKMSRRLREKGVKRVGIDSSAVSAELVLRGELQFESIDAELWQMRRVKDPDELDLMKRAVRCCQAMYERAGQIIEPGTPELRVFGELHTAAVEAAGGPMTAPLGNDFTCGTPGGPPREGKVAEAGKLYILDVGPTVGGYFADNARTFTVGRDPTDEQLNAWRAVMSCHELVQEMARPGARCREIYSAMDDRIREATGRSLPHHGGHGVGLQPHEFPHLNPKWDDVLIEGEILSVEPGIYGEELGGGMRIENQYLITRSGPQNLLSFPPELG